MSRVGKNPVTVPAGVDISVSGQTLSAKGKLGNLSVTMDQEVDVSFADNKVVITPRDKSCVARSKWGLYRSMVMNVVKGVSEGYTITLEINGVGYRAALQGKDLVLALGFSHEVRFPIPPGITIKADKPTELQISGADKQQVGQVAAQIRAMKPPEPYKGKGIKYSTETILRKEGKKK